VYFSGRVHTVIHEDDAQAFYILKMVLDKSNEQEVLGIDSPKDATVRGYVHGVVVKIGSWFGFEAKWTDHPEYGRQLVISRAPVLQNEWDADTAAKMLVSNGVGERVVMAVRLHHGEDDFLAALGDEAKLKEVPAIDEFTALYIKQRWETTRAYFQTLAFLGDIGIPAGKVREVWATFGDDAEKVLSTNPWAMVRVEGITFSNADEVAMRLGLDMTSPERVRGAVLSVTRSQRSFGHLYLLTGQLMSEVQMLVPEVGKKAVAQALAACHKSEDVVIDRDTEPGVTAVYEPWWWEMEKEASALIRERKVTAGFGKGGLGKNPYIKRLASVGPNTEKVATAKRKVLLKVVETAISEWGDSANIDLNADQKKGVLNALTQPVSVLTGLPGTGKTTSLQAVVRILQDADISYLLCAPTGIAAKNLATLTGAKASTIHRAFSARGKYDNRRESTYAGVVGQADTTTGGLGKDELWGYSPDNPYPAEVVVVDEASMLDQHLMYRLMHCTSPQCRVVIVGDAAQLPSVGPGNVLRDLIACGQFPVVDLTAIFRQKDTSGIVFAAHSIFHGEVPDYEEGGKGDFALVQTNGDERVLEVILKLAEKLYAQRRNFQILSPRHDGTVGVTNLNAKLRALLNPRTSGAQEIKLGNDTVREDDRIMVVKNNYKLGVFNGDVGKVVRLDRRAKEIEVKIFGEPPLHIRVPYRDAPRLIRLAYACTVHKAQGLEYDFIVMPLVDGFRHQLQRNLLYTAVTRAKKRVFLVGSHSALASAVSNDREDLRNTLFRARLTNSSQGGSKSASVG